MRTGLIVILIILTMTACFHKKKELPDRKPADFQLITNAKRTISLTAPSLGWRKSDKSPFDLALVRDGTTIQIGILATKKERTPEQLLEKALHKLRIKMKTETTFTPYTKRSDAHWCQGEGIVLVSSREKFEVLRAIHAFYFREQRASLILIAVGLQDEMTLLNDEIEAIVQAVHYSPDAKQQGAGGRDSTAPSSPPPQSK